MSLSFIKQSSAPSGSPGSWNSWIFCCYAPPKEPEGYKRMPTKEAPKQLENHAQPIIDKKPRLQNGPRENFKNDLQESDQKTLLNLSEVQHNENESQSKVKELMKQKMYSSNIIKKETKNIKPNKVEDERLAKIEEGHDQDTINEEEIRQVRKSDVNKSFDSRKDNQTPNNTSTDTEIIEEKIEKANSVFGTPVVARKYIKLPGTSSLPLPAIFGIVNITMKYDPNLETFIFELHNVEQIPTKTQAGASSYQVRIVVIASNKRRWHSTISPASDLIFNEKTKIFNLPPNEMASAKLRLRLYGCSRWQRSKLFGELTLKLSELDLNSESSYAVTLESRLNEYGISSQDGDSVDSVCRMETDSPKLHYSESSSRSLSTPESLSPGPRCKTLPMNYREKVKEKETAEMLIGAGWNEATGSLLIMLHRAIHLNFPNNPLKIPRAYAVICVESDNESPIFSAKTGVARKDQDPYFNETFAFEIHGCNINRINIVVYVYHSHRFRRDEIIGWFVLIHQTSSEEERTHWNEVLNGSGEVISKWHRMLEPTKLK